MQIQASDADEGSNSQLTYGIEGIYISSSFDPDLHQDFNSTKHLKRNNIHFIANEFWRKHFHAAKRGASQLPKVVSKSVSRHFHVEQVSGEVFGRNLRALMDLLKSKNGQVSKSNISNDHRTSSIFLELLIVLSVRDFGDPPLESHAVVLVVLDDTKIVAYNDSIVSDSSSTANETSFFASNRKTKAGWRRWFWIAMGTTFSSLLLIFFLILFLYCLCTRCFLKKRREKSVSVSNVPMCNNVSESRMNTEVVRMKDNYGGNRAFLEQEKESESSSNRKLPSLLSKRKQSIRTSSTGTDINQSDTFSFDHGLRVRNLNV